MGGTLGRPGVPPKRGFAICLALAVPLGRLGCDDRPKLSVDRGTGKSNLATRREAFVEDEMPLSGVRSIAIRGRKRHGLNHLPYTI